MTEYLEKIEQRPGGPSRYCPVNRYHRRLSRETDEDFEDTLDVVRQVKYAQAYSFIYSPRPGTTAANMEHQVENQVASERLQILQELLQQPSKLNSIAISSAKKCLYYWKNQGASKGQLVGRSPYLQLVHVMTDNDLDGADRQGRD